MAGLDDVICVSVSAREVVERHRIWNARRLSQAGVLKDDNLEGNNMSHMVIYRGTDGSPGYHQADEVHDAVAFVEQLRNDQGVEEAKIFRMEEVTFEYRPYFRVELVSSDRTLSAPAAKPAVAAAPAAPAVPAAPVAVTATPAAPAAVAPAAVVTEVVEAAETPAAPATPPPVAPDANGDVGARRGLFGR